MKVFSFFMLFFFGNNSFALTLEEMLSLASYNKKPLFTSYTDRYGPVLIPLSWIQLETDSRETKISKIQSAKSKILPWSGHWYPHNKSEILQGEDFNYFWKPVNIQGSPLWKYDQYVLKTRGFNPKSWKKEKDFLKLYEKSVHWSGLCDAWAFASIFSKEPKRSIQKNGITFTVRDQKALLLKIFEQRNYPNHLNVGQKNDGSYKANYLDLYPEQILKIVQRQLFERKLPFIFDHDAGIEVWNEPVFAAKLIVKETKIPNRLKMILQLTSASSQVLIKNLPEQRINFVGTKKNNRSYHAYLVGKKEGDFFRVEHGEWDEETEGQNSAREHPDYVIIPPFVEEEESFTYNSLNAGINASIVREILQ